MFKLYLNRICIPLLVFGAVNAAPIEQDAFLQRMDDGTIDRASDRMERYLRLTSAKKISEIINRIDLEIDQIAQKDIDSADYINNDTNEAETGDMFRMKRSVAMDVPPIQNMFFMSGDDRIIRRLRRAEWIAFKRRYLCDVLYRDRPVIGC